MKEECLICKAPLEYFIQDRLMECVLCHKKERSKTQCVKGHFVCTECHTQGLHEIFGVCQQETSCNPIEILDKMMQMPFCHMHGPEHHVMVGAALLTAYRNAGGELDLTSALEEMYRRGKEVPGGSCGFWGACGAGNSAGQFMAIATKSTPLAREPWGLSNRMSAKALEAIGSLGGPRCCKRDSYLAILAAVELVAAELRIQMESHMPVCVHSHKNNQCLAQRCPFYGGKR